jgi:hypothetical protein
VFRAPVNGEGLLSPILAIVDGGKELIPGKFWTKINMAFYSYGGKEHICKNYKMVRGTFMAKG